MPVNITGLDRPPEAGEKFFILDDIGQARQLAADRGKRAASSIALRHFAEGFLRNFPRVAPDSKLGVKEEKVILNLIVRADAQWFARSDRKRIDQAGSPRSRNQDSPTFGWWVTVAT